MAFESNQINVNAVALNAEVFVTAAAGANNNNVEVNKTAFAVTTTSNNDPITGFAFGAELDNGSRIVLIVKNTSANTLVLKHEDTNSTAANRITTDDGQDLKLEQDQSIRLQYDPATTRWVEADIVTKKKLLDHVSNDLGEFTLAGLPAASSNAGKSALVTNAAGGRTIVRSDGTNWKIVAVEGITVS